MAPRDGLQMLNRSASIALEERVALVAALQRARLHYIEAGAFVSPRRVPAMADSADLFARLSPYAGELAALVPNLEHFERCTAAPNVDTVARGYAVRAHVSGASAT
jgi:hydroxymethylglutaryl-CoA lyase